MQIKLPAAMPPNNSAYKHSPKKMPRRKMALEKKPEVFLSQVICKNPAGIFTNDHRNNGPPKNGPGEKTSGFFSLVIYNKIPKGFYYK
jgi:hypothetical protein